MYKKPTLQRFGSFRELTKQGTASAQDIAAVLSSITGIGNATGCDGTPDWSLWDNCIPGTSQPTVS